MFLDLRELGYEGSYDRMAAFSRQWKVGQMERVKAASKSTELVKPQAVQARIDADALFERQKAKHKMRAGVQLLGDMGAEQAKRLMRNCEDIPNLLPPNRGESSMMKEQWRQSRCGGYYKEGVADLLRKLRIRGIVSN
ncbi:hypothetical protein [Herbaspirillum robiniae]|uniref:Regulatory protein RecX n=1 Tax=Herbaspirillum robiniae TaxID=2014887 RepID=A0ABX2M127_9BURK|nr:hypothetical protein [Herbaspirillum robiniae]NUU04086.1 hypothetical protein [Herbaspirillum robiniae]